MHQRIAKGLFWQFFNLNPQTSIATKAIHQQNDTCFQPDGEPNAKKLPETTRLENLFCSGESKQAMCDIYTIQPPATIECRRRNGIGTGSR